MLSLTYLREGEGIETGRMGDFYNYLYVFVSQWWWFLTSGPYVMDPLLESISTRYHWWKVQHFSQTTWQRGKLILALIGFFFAGFFAWRDEHLEVKRIRERPANGEEAKAQIDNLTQMNQQLQQKVEALERQTLPRVLTDDQRKKLIEVLSNVPPGETYVVSFQVSLTCDACSRYAEELRATWGSLPGWKADITLSAGVNFRLVGVAFGYNPSTCRPAEVQLIEKALNVAGIDHVSAPFSDEQRKIFSLVSCGVFVGNKPQE